MRSTLTSISGATTHLSTAGSTIRCPHFAAIFCQPTRGAKWIATASMRASQCRRGRRSKRHGGCSSWRTRIRSLRESSAGSTCRQMTWPRRLEPFAGHPKLVGVRHIVQGEPDDKFMLRSAFCRGISYLEDLNLTYDILIYPRHLPVAAEFVSRFRRQRFVLDHLAKPDIRSGG